MNQKPKKTIDVTLLKNLAASWRGSGGTITIQPEQCEFLKLVALGEPTPAGAVKVKTKDFVAAVDKVTGEPKGPQGDSEGPPKEFSKQSSEGSPKSKKKKLFSKKK